MKPTANMEALPDFYNYQPRPELTDIKSLKKFRFIGMIIGWAIQSYYYNISMDMNIIFWKHLLKMPITTDDLFANDKFRHQMLELITNGSYPSTFEADLGTGDEVELCENGGNIEVT